MIVIIITIRTNLFCGLVVVSPPQLEAAAVAVAAHGQQKQQQID